MNRKTLAFGLLFLIVLSLVIAFFPRNKTISLNIEGEEQHYETTRNTVGDFLLEEGIVVYQEDKIEPPLDTKIKDNDQIEIIRATNFVISANGDKTQIFTALNTPEEILDAAGIGFTSKDLIIVNGVEHTSDSILPKSNFAVIEIRQPLTLTLMLEDETIIIETTAATIGEALWEAEIPFYQNEQLSLPPSTILNKATTVTLSPAKIFEIIIGEQSHTIRSSGITVGEVLAQTGFSLQNLDYSIPNEDQAIPESGKIEVIRVEESILGEQELVPFELLRQAMPDQILDTSMILQVGEYGLKTKRIRVRYENGEEVSRTVEDELQAKEPVPRIEGYGTQIDIRLLDTPHGTIEYYRAMEFYITSYYAGDSTTPPWYGRVYCFSREFEPGFVGVDLDYVPCGTKLYIEGFGFATAMDTGAIAGAWVDIGYRDDEYQPWHQYGMVYFLTPVPDVIPYIIPPGTYFQ